MRHVNVSKARAELPNLIDSSERTVITRNGRPVAVLLSVADFRALRAAADLAREPERAAEILRLHQQVQRGDFSDFRRLDLGDGDAVAAKYPSAEESAPGFELREPGGDDLGARLVLLEQSILTQVRQMLAKLRAELAEGEGGGRRNARRSRAR